MAPSVTKARTRNQPSGANPRPNFPDLKDRVRSQRVLQPELYGRVDFDAMPFRHTVDPAVESSLPSWVAPRGPILANSRAIELVSTTTMLGDVVADPYASLLRRYGIKCLVSMLKQACRDGVESVDDAPEELARLIESMETLPSWVDPELVDEGARLSRIPTAFLAPFVVRGAFLATFLNTYAALPMAMTGALSGRRAAGRINETTSFFTVTTLPGALGRYGPGFEAAAMVRLMHSVVRVNALTRPATWDVGVYGVPIPQVDQMPAGMINMYLAAAEARRKGRIQFNADERAMLEFSRYRNYLLGLPEELSPTTIDGIIELFHARAACLRDGFDDTCRRLVDATLDAYLRPSRNLFEQVADKVEKSWSKQFIFRLLGSDRQRAAEMGVSIGPDEMAIVAMTTPFVIGRFLAVSKVSQVPPLRGIADFYTTQMIKARLTTYGRPEFTTDPHQYPAG